MQVSIPLVLGMEKQQPEIPGNEEQRLWDCVVHPLTVQRAKSSPAFMDALVDSVSCGLITQQGRVSPFGKWAMSDVDEDHSGSNNAQRHYRALGLAAEASWP